MYDHELNIDHCLKGKHIWFEIDWKIRLELLKFLGIMHSKYHHILGVKNIFEKPVDCLKKHAEKRGNEPWSV